jgi:FtsP/CotA-like multicopper oxidase with cupredoxin domain
MDHDAMGDMAGMAHRNGAKAEDEGPPRGWADASTPKGMKALSYADLKSLSPQKDTREPGREIIVELGGNMERFIWTINDKKFEDTEPIQLRYGERVKLTFVNDTMMAHPMHLHGMFVQLVNGQPAERLPNKHVVNIAPGQSYSVLLTADELGEWAFHCHLLYHMAAGMMTKVVVARLTAEVTQ